MTYFIAQDSSPLYSILRLRISHTTLHRFPYQSSWRSSVYGFYFVRPGIPGIPGIAEGRIPPCSSFPPRSARLKPSFDTRSPTGCSNPPWPTCPATAPFTPSCSVSTCSIWVTLALSSCSIVRYALVSPSLSRLSRGGANLRRIRLF